MNLNIFQFVIENTGFVMQIVIYFLIFICAYCIIKPEKEVVFSNSDTKSGLSKEDKKMMKMSKNIFIKLFIPKQKSKLYKKDRQKFDKIKNSIKYKNLTIFYVKRAYYMLIAIGITALINCIPLIMLIIQKIVNVGDLSLIVLPKWIIIFSLLLPVFAYLYPKIEINFLLKKREIELKKEIISLGIFVHTMLETGNNPYDILDMIKEIKPVYKKYIEIALNEYYVNTKKSLENLKKQIGMWEFDMIIDSLIFAHESDNFFASKFLNEYITRLEQTFKISSEKTNKIKPYFLLFSSIPPLVAALLIWFYPWLIQATENLTKGLGM